MPINTLTDLNDLITNGTAAERLAFKNIIVGGLDAQDLADIITSSTRPQKEALATLVLQAETFLNETTGLAELAQYNADIAIANTWWDNNILPTLIWSSGQPLNVQRANIVSDYNLAKGLLDTETDEFRIIIIREKIGEMNAQFKAIKQAGG